MGTPHWWFSWAGGTIPAPFIATVSGDTHGGKVETLSTTADTTAGEVTLTNFTATNLTEGAIYGVAGPGVLDGSLLVYSAASGADKAAYTLNAAPTETGGSITLVITKPITVAQTSGDVAGGSITNIADTAALVVGVTYGVTGPGIPLGTMAIWGGGATAALITISGAAVDTPTESGVAITFSGLPSAASGLITNVSGVADLTPGATYNISGPGIAKGSTFVADGTGQIALDQVATASALGASLTIDGPLVETEPFDAAKHAVEDARIRSIKISQKEGNFAVLDIELQNPGTGLLAAGRQEWCWLSYDAGDGEIVPVFNGRLTGAFADFHKELVQLSFVAQPNNYAARKREIADTLTVLPYYDPAWYTSGTPDADVALEAISALWHIDRTTLEVTTSDILVGEDGTLEVGEDDHRYDTMSVTIGQPPITRVYVTGTVSWTQQGSGTIDITSQTNKLFSNATSMYGGSLGFDSVISTLSDGLKTDWPKAGTSIGGGWSVGLDTDITTASWVTQYDTSTSFDSADVKYFDEDLAKWKVTFPIYSYKLTLDLDWDASRKRTETVEFTMISDLQRLLSQPAGADEETITLTAADIGEAVDSDFTPPIGDLRRNSYFNTSRGISSVEYLMLMARAKIRARARAIEIKFQCRLEDVLGISCRQNVHLKDRRLPGGEASGKVVAYDLVQDQNGRPYAEITIGCSIGRGGSVTATEGSGDFVDAGTVGDGVQLTVGGETTLVASELVYQPLTDFQAKDDGLDLFDLKAADAINSFTLTNGLKDQIAAVTTALDPVKQFDLVPTRLCLDLKPVQGVEFHTDYLPAVKPLPIPQTIDLEAT